jgi:hypothetical protein
MLHRADFDVGAAAAEFRDTGVIRVPGAFTEYAPALERSVREHVARRFGIVEDDPSTWTRRCDGAIATRRLRHTGRFAAVVAAPVRALLDEVFGPGGWSEPSPARALVTPPCRDPSWTVPTGFHFDFPFDRPAWPGPGLLLFSFLADCEAGGGGTCVVPGTHRLVDAFLAAHADLPVDRRFGAFLRRQGEWLRQLVNDADADPARTARCFEGAEVGGVPLRVLELTGRAGDVIVTHGYTLHSPAPNTSTRMRLMLSTGIGVKASAESLVGVSCPVPMTPSTAPGVVTGDG